MTDPPSDHPQDPRILQLEAYADLFDMRVLDDLQQIEDDSGQPFVRKLFEDFLATIPQDIRNLEDAGCGSPDALKKITQQAHKIKGVCASLGMQSMMDVSGDIQKAAASNRPKEVALKIQMLKTTFERVCQYCNVRFDL